MRALPVAAFDREWRKIHDSVFLDRHADERPFRNDAWEAVLVPYALNMEEDVFTAIGTAARPKGDDELVIWNAEVLTPEPGAIIPWSYTSLNEVRCSILGHFETHLFGRSGSWGVVCSVVQFSWVGGDATLMDSFARALGGRDAVRKRFLDYARDIWTVPEASRSHILQSVGWRMTNGFVH